MTAARPTRLAAIVVAIVAVVSMALPLPFILPVLLAVAALGCIGVDLLVARRQVVTFERTELGTLALGEPVPFHAAAAVADARSVRLRQPLPPGLGLEQAIADGAPAAEIDSTIVGRHRGRHELGPAVIRTTGPLGLGSLDHVAGGTAHVTVFPNLPRARRLAAARRRGRATDEGRIRARLGLGTEFETIRDYSPDDDIRQVNWVATSRVGRPMSNQYRVEENRDVILLLDTGRLMASPIGPLTRLDVALDALTVLAVAAEEAGDRVGATAFQAMVTRQLAPRRKGAEAIVRALYDLEPVEVESDYERAFQAVGRHKRALVVLFTDLVDEAATRTLLQAAPVLLRHHAVLVASSVDEDLRAAVTSPPNDVRDVMRAAVALDVLASRGRAVALLRSLGASIVEATPDKLGPACVRAYLRLKQHARL
jgi:uncharacterized protein (DUF58 family)